MRVKDLRKPRTRRVLLSAIKVRPKRFYNKLGRPGFRVTQQMRDTVYLMRCHGASHDYVAHAIINQDTGKPIGKTTLRRHFQNELDRGMAEAKRKVGAALMDRACGAPARVVKDGKRMLVHEAVEPDLAAVKWWQGTRT